jgi:hypothetical protein
MQRMIMISDVMPNVSMLCFITPNVIMLSINMFSFIKMLVIILSVCVCHDTELYYVQCHMLSDAMLYTITVSDDM